MHVKRNSRKSEKKFNITLNERKNSISARNAQEMAFLSAALHFAPLKQRLKRKCFYQTWLLADIYSHQFIRAAVKKKTTNFSGKRPAHCNMRQFRCDFNENGDANENALLRRLGDKNAFQMPSR